MKKTYSYYLIIPLISIFLSLTSKASHYTGGEITWESKGNDTYVFTINFYRDCRGVNITSDSLKIEVFNHPSVNYFYAYRTSIEDISPYCGIDSIRITCTPENTAYSGTFDGSYEKHIYVSNPILLDGTPPDSGWIFSNDSYARNYSIDNIVNPSSTGMTLFAIMYDNSYQSSSVQFIESAYYLIPVLEEFYFNNLAYNDFADSLSYKFTEPLDDFSNYGTFNPISITFETGYSYDNPFPGNATQLNPLTGEVSLYSNKEGVFISAFKVEAWKCGKLISEVNRDMQFIIFDDKSANNPPDVNAPFQDTTTGLYTVYSDTFYAGENVSFSLSASDYDALNDGSPQSIIFDAHGIIFADDYTDTADCPYPPCATLTNVTDTAQYTIGTTFNWNTSCSNLTDSSGCYSKYKTFDMVYSFTDDYCPYPKTNTRVISITLIDSSFLANAPVLSLDSVSINNESYLSWSSPSGSQTGFMANILYGYYENDSNIFVIDSLFSSSQTTFIIPDSLLYDTFYVFMNSLSGCSGQEVSMNSDTLTIIPYQNDTVHVSYIFDFKNNIQVYPNPVQDHLSVIISDNHIASELIAIKISDISGKIIYHQYENLSTSKFVINTKHIKPGYYLLTMEFENQVSLNKKIISEKH